MKTVIFYFSGTGNNLNIAKRLQDYLGGADIFPIRYLQEQKEIPEYYTHVVFSVPSYYSHIPPYVAECLQNVKFTEGQMIVNLIGCAGNRGVAAENMNACIQACGKDTSGEYMLVYAGNYILSYGAFPKLYQNVVEFFAGRKLKKIALAMKNGNLTKLSKPGFLYRESKEERLQKSIAEYSEIGRNYEISEQCKGCGICTKVCPVGNIHIEDGKPHFGDQCQQCMACVQWCPSRAIDYKGKAHNRKRYHHSDVTLQDIMKKRE